MMYEKRGLFIDEEHLEGFAENFARSLRPEGAASGRPAAAELHRDLRRLEELHDALALKWSGIPSMPGAVRWLLDNRYLIQREGAAAAEELAGAAQLRIAPGGTVLQRLCDSLLRTGHCELSDARIILFLRGFQRALILEHEELTLLPSGLKAAAVSMLERLCRELLSEPDADPEAETARLITVLRYLGSADLRQLIESADLVEQTLRSDPAGIYPAMAERSRAYYRLRLAQLARRRGLPEHMVAKRLVTLAEEATGPQRHVGYWLLVAPPGRRPKPKTGGSYIGTNVLLTLLISLLLGFAGGSPAVFVLLLIPVSELVKQAVDFFLLHLTKPVHIPRLALENGVPKEGRTLCVISSLLTGPDDGAVQVQALEEVMLLNRDAGPELCFALLADLPDTAGETVPEGDAAISAAAAAVDALNRRYGGGFLLLTRPRIRTPEGRWMGWERKRGALLETMRLLRGQHSGMSVAAGDAAALGGVRFLLVLDSDTRMSPGAAKEMIGAMLHPLCHPVIDNAKGIVTAGHAILAPRLGVDLSAAGRSDFSRIFAGQGGTDPYGGACSELYMDLFGRSGFAGKGILDIDAYLLCMGDRVPENRMLSHDAVEGAYLRCGFLGDVELCDGFPSGVLPWLRRQERWCRGDWQNLPWLSRRGRALPELERWRLLESLRRSLVPVTTLTALTVGFFLPGRALTLAAAAALLALLSELLLAMAETALQKDSQRGIRYRSALFVGFGGGLVRTLLRLILLPAEAWFCFSAAVKALWRMAVTKQHLLQWRTADENERGRDGLLRCYRELWFAPLLGLLLLAFSPGVIGKAAGTLWLLSPLCALLLSLPATPPLRLSREEQAYLYGCAEDTWRYFDAFLTPAEHWLPPDNFQSRPPAGLARRTSPTNIGLALLSVLAALDLGFLSREEALARLDGCLSTLEALPKWKGHLYNWYDTGNCTPLEPRYVSTVDSGNLCACLIALRSGLAACDAAALASRAGALADAMSFAPLFDRERKLFYIGIDLSLDKPSDAWYDLLASEARLAAYLAVARGDIPREAWRRLSRAQLQFLGYRGMASWTGTMFEYLMPELLLPLQKNSLLWESARYCLFVQQRRVRGLSLPWGVSESAYWALDPAMSYRYKAHGCAHLALKRGMDSELVLSPYSSFLALAVRPHAAIANLRKLERLEMRESYGFWEALDCTASRLGGGGPKVVRCVMAHHAGMSIISAVNLLRGGVMRERFFSDPAMGAYRGLLEERVPVGGSILRSPGAERRRPPPSAAEHWERTGTGTDFRRPACCLLASQTYSLLVTESGITRPRWGAIAPYVSPRSPLDREKGMELFLDSGGAALSLLPDAYGPAAAEYSWQFGTAAAVIAADCPVLQSRMTVTLGEGDVGERRAVTLCNAGAEPFNAKLVLRFRPLLAREADYRSHPAFLGLGISARLQKGCLLLRRLARGETRELWMCLAASRPCVFDLAPGADTGRSGGHMLAAETEFYLTDPLVTAVCPVTLEVGATGETVFALGMAYSETEALESAARLLAGRERADLPQTAATVMGLDRQEMGDAFALLPDLCFPAAPAALVQQRALWPLGISGDLPILCARYGSNDLLPRARRLMDAHLFLCGCGCDFDLVLLSRDGASYHRPLRTALGDALWRGGGEVLRDARGGVHIIEDDATAAPVLAAAVREIRLDGQTDLPGRSTGWQAAAPSNARCFPPQGDVHYEWNSDGSFQFYVNRSLPPRVWQCILSNGRMGYLATDCGTGHLWDGNARETQLTPWLCRPHATDGPERLLLQCGGGLFSLFAAPNDSACRVSFLPGTAVWEKKIDGALLRTTAFVPMDCDARVFLIQCDAPPRDARLHWQLALQMSGNPADARFCSTAAADGGLNAENCRGDRPFRLYTSPPPGGFTCDRAAALALDYNGVAGLSAEPALAVTLGLGTETVLVCGCDTPERLRALADPATAQAALARTKAHWKQTLDVFSLRSPASALDKLMNGWVAYQVIACRLLGRCSIYQSGGAFGFRDQLQDAVNLILLDAAPARAQILRCCTRQYTEGDVQHWWHERGMEASGVRTRCSDDLLWLPWAVCEYVEKTGDSSVCGEQIAYLSSPVLLASEKDRYESPGISDIRENVLRHCRRALELVIARGCGPHGLLRMGSGDWNDGYDAVGGESQWLSWFFLHVSGRFSALCRRLGADWEVPAQFLASLTEATDRAWDGQWYLRGWYADGSPLGSCGNGECRLDSVAQSWAALSGCADPEKAAIGLESALKLLFDREHSLIKLLDPPFAGLEHPGYVVQYGPGFRENGGQYTHGALWLVMALLRLRRREEAWELLSAILPADRDTRRYLCEPYVLAADVYAAPGHTGEGGWSWYTGSAGWLLRIVTEELLGLKLRNGLLFIEPVLPAGWDSLSLRLHGHRIQYSASDITVDGVKWDGTGVKL